MTNRTVEASPLFYARLAALVAMCFRLAQTAVLALNLLHYHAAMLLLNDTGYSAAFGMKQLNALTSFFLDMHGHGYDLGLLLFGLHCLLLALWEIMIPRRILTTPKKWRWFSNLSIIAINPHLVRQYFEIL